MSATAEASCQTPMQAAHRLAAAPMRDGFLFEALHEFTDSQGKALHWRIRLKHPGTGEKWIRPMQRFGELVQSLKLKAVAHRRRRHPLRRLHRCLKGHRYRTHRVSSHAPSAFADSTKRRPWRCM